MSTYDRWPNLQDSQLLDATTALKALLGTETEIAFKLAYRVATLLAASDAERAQMLKTMKDFYDTRSKLVHGSALKPKHHQCLQQVDDLRSLVRRLLRAFVALACRYALAIEAGECARSGCRSKGCWSNSCFSTLSAPTVD